MDYLALSRALAQKAAIPRNGLTNVAATTSNEHEDCVTWIKDAWRTIQTLRQGKWKFLQSEYSRQTRDDATLDADVAVDNSGGLVGIPITGHGFSSGDLVYIEGTTNYDGTWTAHATTSANQLVITATYVAETFDGTEVAVVRDYEYLTADGVQSFDEMTFFYYLKTDGRSQRKRMKYVKYQEFNDKYLDWLSPNAPTVFTLTPDKKIRVHPAPDAVYVIEAVSFDVPVLLAANTDEPVIDPQFHMMIVWRALMDYGGFEESGSVYEFAGNNYDELMDQLIWQESYDNVTDKTVRPV